MNNNIPFVFPFYGYKKLTTKIARLKRRIKMNVNKDGVKMKSHQDMLCRLEAEDQGIKKQAEYRQASNLSRHLLNSRRNSTIPANKDIEEECIQILTKFRQARLRRMQLLHLRRNTNFPPNPDDQHSSPT